MGEVTLRQLEEANRAVERARQEGYDAGYRIGHEMGYDEGHAVGWQQGYDDMQDQA